MKYLFIFNQSPYGSSLSREALDMSLAAAAFDQEVSLLFMGDAVFQLIANHQPKGTKNIEKTLAALDLYDIEDIYLEESAIEKFQIKHEDLSISPLVLNSQDIQALIKASDKVMSF